MNDANIFEKPPEPVIDHHPSTLQKSNEEQNLEIEEPLCDNLEDLRINGNNSDDGLNEDLWPPFC